MTSLFEPPALPFDEETYSVSELCGELRDLVQQAFPSVWVAGEVNRLRRHRSGHLYFELVEKGGRDEIVGKLEGVAWRTDRQRIERLLAAEGQEIAEGQQIRCRGNLDFYGPFGRLQFVVRDVDPVFTLGLLARRRRETLAALAAAGLLEANRALPLPELPLRLALVTSEGSAAYHDFLTSLGESGYGFRVLLLHAAVQGSEAERQVASALAALPAERIDCAVLVRGGGSRTDLAVFDSRRIAEAVARAPVPVLTGLGHQTDQAIADVVAHAAFKTPTKVAEFLVARVRAAEDRLLRVERSLAREALEPLKRARLHVGRAERGLGAARWRLTTARQRAAALGDALARSARRRLVEGDRWLAGLGARLAAAAPRALERRAPLAGELAGRIAAASRAQLRQAALLLEGRERLAVELSPRRTLERGFTITRHADGALLGRGGRLEAGERLTTQWAGGTVASRVEEG